ncbi:hypothetical protein N9N03_00475 [Chlamydiia bacterium]|nr:hypothetical protein [Chlamydiia bacterium]
MLRLFYIVISYVLCLLFFCELALAMVPVTFEERSSFRSLGDRIEVNLEDVLDLKILPMIHLTVTLEDSGVNNNIIFDGIENFGDKDWVLIKLHVYGNTATLMYLDAHVDFRDVDLIFSFDTVGVDADDNVTNPDFQSDYETYSTGTATAPIDVINNVYTTRSRQIEIPFKEGKSDIYALCEVQIGSRGIYNKVPSGEYTVKIITTIIDD